MRGIKLLWLSCSGLIHTIQKKINIKLWSRVALQCSYACCVRNGRTIIWVIYIYTIKKCLSVCFTCECINKFCHIAHLILQQYNYFVRGFNSSFIYIYELTEARSFFQCVEKIDRVIYNRYLDLSDKIYIFLNTSLSWNQNNYNSL